MKIDWKLVWFNWEEWYDRYGWRKNPYIHAQMKKKIQSLVEAQLRRKKRGS